MQFSIPKWENVLDSHSGTTHQVFLIYLNGFLHSRTRYSQLYELHSKLKSHYGDVLDEIGAKFPPRHLMLLNSSDIELRRDKLETYLQNISQCTDIITGPELINFLVKQQISSFTFKNPQQKLPIMLPNHSVTDVNIDVNSTTLNVLLAVGDRLGLPKDYLFAFKLVLIGIRDKILIYHKLLISCECPLLALNSAKLESPSTSFYILLRKMLSSSELEVEIFGHPLVRQLAADEVRQDLKHNFCLPKDKSFPKAKLMALPDEMLLHNIHKIRYYGCIKFNLSCANFPDEKSYVVPRFGKYAVFLEFSQADGSRAAVTFKVNRIKCWSVGEIAFANSLKHFNYKFELCFEYYMSRDKALLIKILTNEAVMMSLCIQQMIDELSLINAQKGIEQVALTDEFEMQVDEVRSDTDSLNALSTSSSDNPNSVRINGHESKEVQLVESVREVSRPNCDERVVCASNEQETFPEFSFPTYESQYPCLSRLKKPLSKENMTFEKANFDSDL